MTDSPTSQASARLLASMTAPVQGLDRTLRSNGLVAVSIEDLTTILSAVGAAATPAGITDAFAERVERAAAQVLEEKAAYFDATTGHYTRADAAGAFRASKRDVATAVRRAIAAPVPEIVEIAYMGIDAEGNLKPFLDEREASRWANVGEAPGGSVHPLTYIDPPLAA